MPKDKIRWIFLVVLLLVSLFFLFKVRNIISPFIVAIVLAYLLSPLVAWLEKKGLNRKLGIALIFVVIILSLGVFLFFLLPKLYSELTKLVEVLPERIERVYNYGQNIRNTFADAGLPAEVNKLIDEQLENGQTFLIESLKGFVKGLPGLFASLGLLVLAPFLTIYFLIDWEKISEAVVKMVPQKRRGSWKRILQDIDTIIRKYIQGNLIDALIVGIMVGIGVKILGMEYAFVVGSICAVTNLIPYFGPLLGAVPSILLALSKSPGMALKVALVIFIVQQIDSNIINPKLMSNKIGLHPLWIVFAILAGGELGGLLGMLVAIPLAAILRMIIKDTYNYLVAPRTLETYKK